MNKENPNNYEKTASIYRLNLYMHSCSICNIACKISKPFFEIIYLCLKFSEVAISTVQFQGYNRALYMVKAKILAKMLLSIYRAKGVLKLLTEILKFSFSSSYRYLISRRLMRLNAVYKNKRFMNKDAVSNQL